MMNNKTMNINNQVDKCGNTNLHVASSKNDIKKVTYLITHGANIDAINMFGDTPLHIACMHGHKETVSLLIDNGANVNLQNNANNTPLHIAYYYGNEELKHLLLNNNANTDIELGIDVDSQYPWLKDYYTPLAFECYIENIENVKKLLELGADVNKANSFGHNIPLSIACINGNIDIAKLLIEKGASLTNRDHNGKTPIDFANEANIFKTDDDRDNFITCLKETYNKKYEDKSVGDIHNIPASCDTSYNISSDVESMNTSTVTDFYNDLSFGSTEIVSIDNTQQSYMYKNIFFDYYNSEFSNTNFFDTPLFNGSNSTSYDSPLFSDNSFSSYAGKNSETSESRSKSSVVMPPKINHIPNESDTSKSLGKDK